MKKRDNRAIEARRMMILPLVGFLIGNGHPAVQSPTPRPSVFLRARPRPPAARIQRAPVLGVSPVPRGVPPPKPEDYVAAVDLVEAAGAGGHLGTWNWSALEPSRSSFQLDDVR